MSITPARARDGLAIASQDISRHNCHISGDNCHTGAGHHAIYVLILSWMASRGRDTGGNPVVSRDTLTQWGQEVTFTGTAR
jgi:hypothetical protein